MRRAAALWLLLFAVYAAAVALGDSPTGADERRALRAAEALVGGSDVDSALLQPHGPGFPLLIAPANALGGETAVELFLAALAALAVALGYRLALRVVPDPWAAGAAAAVGVSAPLLDRAGAVNGAPVAAAALAGAALLALRLDARPSRGEAFLCFGLLGALPWLDTNFALAGVAVGAVAARGLWRAHRRTLAIGAVELALFSVALFVAINEALFGEPAPRGTGRAEPSIETLGAAFEPLLQAPVLLLAFAGLWWLWRSRRDHLARAVSGVRDIELAAGLCALVAGAQLLVATLDEVHPLVALPLAIPLVAWGLRHTPRVGVVLSAGTVVVSVAALAG